jgi:hypothetical protein
VNGGKQWLCPFCGVSNEGFLFYLYIKILFVCFLLVDQKYYTRVDITGRRLDCLKRAELSRGSYDIKTTIPSSL